MKWKRDGGRDGRDKIDGITTPVESEAVRIWCRLPRAKSGGIRGVLSAGAGGGGGGTKFLFLASLLSCFDEFCMLSSLLFIPYFSVII